MKGKQNMTLPKVKTKQIDVKEIEKLAKKVRKSLEEEEKYIEERRSKYGYKLLSRAHSLS